MLWILDGTGKFYERTEVPLEKDVNQVIAKVIRIDGGTAHQLMVQYIKDKTINSLTSFSVGTVFHDPWPAEIMPLFNVLQDEALAGSMLGLLVQSIVIRDTNNWVTTKTSLHEDRPETAFYFQKNN